MNTYLNYIKNRETTFPTFLEMLMATYKLIQKAKETGFEHIVQHLIDEQQLIDVIYTRADYQRVGFFYPEVAMYFKIQVVFWVVSLSNIMDIELELMILNIIFQVMFNFKKLLKIKYTFSVYVH